MNDHVKPNLELLFWERQLPSWIGRRKGRWSYSRFLRWYNLATDDRLSSAGDAFALGEGIERS